MMRLVYTAAALSAAFLAGALVEYAAGGPFGLALGGSASTVKSAAVADPGTAATPHYSTRTWPAGPASQRGAAGRKA